MQYTFHPIESRIIDLLFFPQGVDFTMDSKECEDFFENKNYAPEHLFEEFKSIEESLKPFEKRVRKFYYETYSLPRLLLNNYSPFGYSSAELYLDMLEQEDEQAIQISILSKLYLDVKDSDTVDDSVIRRIAQDINQQMDLIGAVDLDDDEKWKLVGLIRDSKSLTLEWIQLMRELQPLFASYYAKKVNQIEALGNRLVKEFNESDGEAISILTKDMMNKSLIPSGRILISCIRPVGILLYATLPAPFVFWGLNMESYVKFVEEARESELKERVLVFKNLGDKTRYEVVKLIAQGVESAKTISKILDVSQPTVSYHINNLQLSKILYIERVDSKYRYKVNFEQLQKCYLAMLKDFGK